MPTLETRWDDKVDECCMPGCTNKRGVTSDGIASLQCQWHVDTWELRLSRLAHDHRNDKRRMRPRPTVQPVFGHRVPLPVGPLTDEQRCSRCGQAPREFPDHLCEECRRG